VTQFNSDHKPLFLTGYMGAGKSTIGHLLADELGYRFFDTDRVIVRRFKKNVSRIFKEEGEAAFRSTEATVLEELAGQSHLVISTGGGTLTRPDLFTLASESGTVIYLKAPVEILFERAIFSRKDRPMLNVPDAELVFRERFQQREAFYNQAHLVVETHGKKTDAVVQEIIERLSLGEPHL
jgi:shikimate kinase